jgi:histidinol phosphatase-like enzyme
MQNNTLHKLEGGNKKYNTPKPKIVIDTNKHGIRRERFEDSKLQKKMERRAK